MKAIVQHKYGSPDVLNLEEVEKPTPGDNELLIKVHAASINALDWHLMRADPFFIRLAGTGFLKPKIKIRGADIAGRVEAIGKNVQQFQVGDEVFGSCGDGGGFAEYVCSSENGLVLKPDNVTFEQAAAVPVAAITALQGLRDAGEIQSGQKVLIHGASGGVGMFAVQIAKSFGTEVTAVCSTRNLEMARAIGADHVIDYRQEDFTQNGQRYDLIFAVNGNRSIFEYRDALNPNGIYVAAGGSGARQMFQPMLLGPWLSRRGDKKIQSMGVAKIIKKDLAFLQELLATGKVVPFIDQCYPLSEVPAAIKYMEDVHAQGKVVISVAHNN
ncbi:MAG: NAD(P)-dependent alcohol dehydrogenase [Chloroflexi bacterium]|nr:NAD(P)-dependent alcohol dehydrogenase [Chloroflexota bacterium]